MSKSNDTFTFWRRGIATSTVRFEQLEDDEESCAVAGVRNARTSEDSTLRGSCALAGRRSDSILPHDDDNDHGQTDPPPKGPAASDRPAGPDAVPTLCDCGECRHLRGETR